MRGSCGPGCQERRFVWVFHGCVASLLGVDEVQQVAGSITSAALTASAARSPLTSGFREQSAARLDI